MNTNEKFPKIQELLTKKWIWIEDAEKAEDGKVYCGSDDEHHYLLGVVGQEEALEAFLQKFPTPWYWGPVPTEYPYSGKLNSQKA
jgi:hypothetical protein